jgi:citrate synthase
LNHVESTVVHPSTVLHLQAREGRHGHHWKAGLEDVIAARSAICAIDGEAGRLYYRGYEVADLAGVASFEQVARLLWFGELPAEPEAAGFDVMKARTSLPVNVDFFSAVVYDALGIPPDLCTSIFAVGRVAGWCAHALEQYADNRLIRPRAEYIGRAPRPLPTAAATPR